MIDKRKTQVVTNGNIFQIMVDAKPIINDDDVWNKMVKEVQQQKCYEDAIRTVNKYTKIKMKRNANNGSYHNLMKEMNAQHK